MANNKNDENDDLVGFEEYINSIGETSALDKNDKTDKSFTSIRVSNPNEHLSFLGHDFERLKKTANLICDRLPQYEKYPQSEQLLQTEIHTLNKVKADLIETLKKDGSIFHHSLGSIINSFFKS